MAKVRYGKFLAAGAALLIIAQSGVIWRLANMDRPAQSTKAEAVDREELRVKNEKLQQENRLLRLDLEKRNASTPTPLPTASQSIAETARGAVPKRLAVLMDAKKLGAVSHVPAAGQSGKLDPKFVRLFELSTSEQKDLQQSLDTAMKTIEQLEAQNATTQKNTEGAVVISVKSYAEKGGVIYDQLLNAFAKTLGPERYEAFTALSAESMERNLGSFGTREKTLTIQWNPTAKYYDVREEYRSFQYSGTSNSQLQTFSGLEKSYPGLAPLIPTELRDKSGQVSK